MRVLHFYKTAFPDTMGGVEQAINQIARGASRFGVETDVLSLASGNVPRTIELDGYHAHRVRLDFEVASTGFSASAFRRFPQLAKTADLIHYHFPWPFMDVVHFASRLDKPSIVTYHSDIVRQKWLHALYRPLGGRFLSSVDRIVATSPNYLASSEVLRKFARKVTVIPLGIDKSSYPDVSPDRLRFWRERLPPGFFLFVGLLRYYKGLHVLLEAAQGADCPVVIVGAGPVEPELKEQAARLGLGNVCFLGHLPDEDKVALLSLCLAVVLPSHLRSEAFGLALLEGAMYGKPMISSELGTGTSFINVAPRTGLAVPPGDPVALRGAMRYLLEHPDEAAAMGRRAEERYWQLFTAERMVRAYVDLYRELTAAPEAVAQF